MNKRIFKCALVSALAGVALTASAAAAILLMGGTAIGGETKLMLILAAALVALAASAIIAKRTAKRISDEISDSVNNIAPAYPNSSAVDEEFTPLIKKLEAHNAQVSEQIAGLKVEHQAQDDMRREFTANVSHELKTPLTSISGYAEIIRAGIAKDEDVRRFAGKIYDESGRLITLVGDIIKLSQLDGNDVTVKIEDIDLYELTEGVIAHLEHAAGKNGVTVTLTGEHIYIRGAEQIVEEIVFNICDNAVKYNRQGGRVDISIRQCVDGVELSVSDTGIGIAEEDIDHVFERFYRADKSHSKEIGGTGLGLSIVKHGVRFMGASVSIQSELNKGTTVRVLF